MAACSVAGYRQIIESVEAPARWKEKTLQAGLLSYLFSQRFSFVLFFCFLVPLTVMCYGRAKIGKICGRIRPNWLLSYWLTRIEATTTTTTTTRQAENNRLSSWFGLRGSVLESIQSNVM